MPEPDQRIDRKKRERSFEEALRRREECRRARIRAGIRRDRDGAHRVPTWVLAAILGLVLAGWLVLIVTR